MSGGYPRGPIPSPIGEQIVLFEEILHRLAILENPTAEQANQTVPKLAAAIADVAATQAATPVTDMNVARATGFGLVDGWATFATAAITVPAGKTRAKLLGIGAGAVLDTGGGFSSSDCRVLIAGVASGQFPAAKDAAASVVNNVLNAQFARTMDVSPGSIIVFEFQIKPLNTAAYPASTQNFAQATAWGTFTA
jgi:hypothetical protein